jgi:hypothetical protein
VTRWRGLVELTQDAVHHGATAVEAVHQRVARAPLDLIARVPPLAAPARAAAAGQAGLIAAAYASVRAVNAVVGSLLVAVVEVVAASRDSVARRPPER